MKMRGISNTTAPGDTHIFGIKFLGQRLRFSGRVTRDISYVSPNSELRAAT